MKPSFSRLTILLCLFFISCSHYYGQGKKTDSTDLQLKTIAGDSVRNSINENELVLLKDKIKHDEEKIQEQKNYIFYGIISLLVILILVSVFLFRSQFKNKSKKQSEKYFEDLRIIEEIGKKITSNFSVEEINTTIYEEINKLMDGTGFGIGIIRDDGESLVFPGYREKGEKLNEAVYSLKDENRLAVHCVLNRREIFINDLYNEVRKYVDVVLDPLTGKRCESIIYLPLINKNKLIGAITVQSFERNAYTQYHLGLLRNIAGHTAIALDNAALYNNMEKQVAERTKEVIVRQEELEKNYDNTQLLSEMGQEITSTLKFETIFFRLYENVNRMMPAEVFGVRIYHPEKNEIEYKFEYENGATFPPIWVSMDDDNNYSVWSIKNKKEIFINDNLKEYTKYVKEIRVVSGDMPHSLIFYPMMVGEKVIGVISVQSFQKQAYKPIHISILKTLASYTAIALENANLYETLEAKVLERTQEVVSQKAIIELKNKDITDSIRYAQKIQSALLPGVEKIRNKVKNFFVLFQPRDIVSGDFYFFTSSGPYNIFAVADCTGHGVPGAIISAICINLTSEVLLDKEVYSSGLALEQIDKKLRTLLKQDRSGQSNDGMDCALCVVNTETNILQFSGASRPLLIARKNELIEFKAGKYSIGGHDDEIKNFETTEFQLEKGDKLYLFSDGYADQFGGEKGKKFKYQRMQQMIKDNSSAPMDEQRDIYHGELMSWKGKFEQVDDILIFGVEI